jgi:hypothetical protein
MSVMVGFTELIQPAKKIESDPFVHAVLLSKLVGNRTKRIAIDPIYVDYAATAV